MSQILESVKLALASIWANKLRSLLTLLGNIVAVSSIITVVSLIQRMGIVRNADEADKQRNNPRVTLDDARAVRKFSEAIDAVMAQAQTSTTVGYQTEELQSIQVQGVS